MGDARRAPPIFVFDKMIRTAHICEANVLCWRIR